VEWRKLGEVSMLGDSYVARSEKELVASFGQEFASHLGDLEIAQWVGPVKSSFGFHLVRLEKISQKEATPLAYIEKRVWADYQQKRMDSALETYYQGLREKYAVVYQ
jgi:parvulin-like peptidyl-prolyl isomerase